MLYVLDLSTCVCTRRCVLRGVFDEAAMNHMNIQAVCLADLQLVIVVSIKIALASVKLLRACVCPRPPASRSQELSNTELDDSRLEIKA